MRAVCRGVGPGDSQPGPGVLPAVRRGAVSLCCRCGACTPAEEKVLGCGWQECGRARTCFNIGLLAGAGPAGRGAAGAGGLAGEMLGPVGPS